jgi:hypothetical protein
MYGVRLVPGIRAAAKSRMQPPCYRLTENQLLDLIDLWIWCGGSGNRLFGRVYPAAKLASANDGGGTVDFVFIHFGPQGCSPAGHPLATPDVITVLLSHLDFFRLQGRDS